ncbi:hypothetical protein [uncultured Murdochiella sp.]|uniref:hypothetical protein n=1 Tax=uncultured Murdochiella sp. TaxID=1586095 RepID=UPI002803A273|nr:hypothetical protein [uncultured Murdochiella sp.]
MKKKIINCAICDARNVSEESLTGYDQIMINAAIILTTERAKQLLDRYPVALNVASVTMLPDNADITAKVVNNKFTLGPDADGKDCLLVVNGKLTLENGSLAAAESFHQIIANGTVLMPRSFNGKLHHLKNNGKIIYYPDGASLLNSTTSIDDLFVQRAQNNFYYCLDTLFFLDTSLNTTRIEEKELRFSAEKVVIAESLMPALLPRIEEETKVIPVPDGTVLLEDDVALKPRTIKKYGSKLYVDGDITIKDKEALDRLEYLYVTGDARVLKSLEDAFLDQSFVYDALKVIDPEIGYVSDKISAKVGPQLLRSYPKGVVVEECAVVKLSPDLSPADILKNLTIRDCATVKCTKEQEEAVGMIAEDIASIDTNQDSEEKSGLLGGVLGEVFHDLKDTQLINAAEYTL